MTESVIRDIIGMAKTVAGGVKDVVGSGKQVSLSRGAKRGTLQFPVIVSRAMSYNDITMISKALEKQYVSFVQVVTSMNASTDEKDVHSYLKSIHQNFGADDTDPFSTAKAFTKIVGSKLEESFNKVHMVNEDALQSTKDFNNVLIVEAKDMETGNRNHYYNKLLEAYGEGKLYRTNKGIFTECDNGNIKEIMLVESLDNEGEYMICESPEYPKDFNYQRLSYDLCESMIMTQMKQDSKEYVYPFIESVLNDLSTNSDIISISEASGRSVANNRIRKTKLNIQPNNNPITRISSAERPMVKDMDKSLDVSKLTDNDVKKVNELVPTLLTLTTQFKDKEGKVKRVEKYIIGVKTIIHSVSSESMMENLVKGVKKDRIFQKLLKYTTGEINFFKDLVFAIDEIKDEIKVKHTDSMWWSALRRRQQKAKYIKALGQKSLLPNATIVLTKDEVETIKQNYRIDFENLNTARSLIKSYYLLGFVILDPSIENAKLMFDGELTFREVTYSQLEKESNTANKELKMMMQAIGRM